MNTPHFWASPSKPSQWFVEWEPEPGIRRVRECASLATARHYAAQHGGVAFERVGLRRCAGTWPVDLWRWEGEREV